MSDYYKDLRKICRPLLERLKKIKKSHPLWSSNHSEIFKKIKKKHVKILPCLGLLSLDSFQVVETDVSELGYKGILKQKVTDSKNSKLSIFIQVYEMLQNKILVQLKKRF